LKIVDRLEYLGEGGSDDLLVCTFAGGSTPKHSKQYKGDQKYFLAFRMAP